MNGFKRVRSYLTKLLLKNCLDQNRERGIFLKQKKKLGPTITISGLVAKTDPQEINFWRILFEKEVFCPWHSILCKKFIFCKL